MSGENITEMPPQAAINMMFSPALFPHMTVAQNIAFGLKQDKLPKAEIEARVAQMLKLVHMERFVSKPHQLSGGQRQRVTLALACQKDPSCCCLMSPWARWIKSCAPKWLEVVEIIEQVGVTCIMVTHDQKKP